PSLLFPYTTLFRSHHGARRLRLRRRPGRAAGVRGGARAADGHHHLGPVEGGVMPRSARSSLLGDDRGSATAETAIVLPGVGMMVGAVLVIGAGLGAQLGLESAARGGASELARGEHSAAAVAVAQRIGGEGIEVTTSTTGAWVQVEVTRTLEAPGGSLAGASWTLSADAQARREPHLVDGGAS